LLRSATSEVSKRLLESLVAFSYTASETIPRSTLYNNSTTTLQQLYNDYNVDDTNSPGNAHYP
jgi:hypothetical protein